MPRKTAKKSGKRNKLNKKHMKTSKYIREPKMKMKNSGFIKTVTSVNNKKNEQILDWDGKYDGKKAIIHAKLNTDGKKENINKTFTNDDIKQLLGYSVVNEPLEMRLKQFEKTVPILTGDTNILFEEPRQNPTRMRHFTIEI